MPHGQLQKVVSAELGPDWRSKMASFEDEPLAAASIGQVGAPLALKHFLFFFGCDRGSVNSLQASKPSSTRDQPIAAACIGQVGAFGTFGHLPRTFGRDV